MPSSWQHWQIAQRGDPQLRPATSPYHLFQGVHPQDVMHEKTSEGPIFLKSCRCSGGSSRLEHPSCVWTMGERWIKGGFGDHMHAHDGIHLSGAKGLTLKSCSADSTSRSMSMVFPTPTPPYMYRPLVCWRGSSSALLRRSIFPMPCHQGVGCWLATWLSAIVRPLRFLLPLECLCSSSNSLCRASTVASCLGSCTDWRWMVNVSEQASCED